MMKLFLLCVLGAWIHGVSGQDSSTQMYYVKLMVEETAILNVTENLLNVNYGSDDYSVSSLKETTDCEVSDRDVKTCRCAEGFEWSASVCSAAQCCETKACITQFTCKSQSNVTISGTLHLGQEFHGCLNDFTTDNFKDCHNKVTQTIKKAYSQIYGFDSLTIQGYRTGSVIVEFAVVVISNVDPAVLQKTSTALNVELNSTLSLETTGVVHLKGPLKPVDFNSNTSLSCSLDRDLGSTQQWVLENYWNASKDIYNGTESTIISGPLTSNIYLTSVSQLWTGRYTCTFQQLKDHLIINHKASIDVDICVLPKIITRTSPGFPHCKPGTALPAVTIICEVENTYEDYVITWEKKNIDAKILLQKQQNALGMTIFTAQTFVSCVSESPTVTCKLKNRCGQTAEAVVNIIVIKVSNMFCQAEGDWEDTKAGEKAVIKCKDSVGNRTRPCNTVGVWGTETSFCVDLKVQGVLSSALICDIGLGKLEQNADSVFSQLQSVTNDTKVINNAANLETSVNVISTMTDKLTQLTNESTVRDFLQSSSNLLDKSVKDSWKTVGKYNDQDFAEKYLKSVEGLIEKADIKRQITKNANLEVVSCNKTLCQNQVFNNTVTMDNVASVSIKTTGFLELEGYLPGLNNGFIPNSIVVSTTAPLQNTVEDIKIQIDFELMRSRPRNTELRCVFWDTASSQWSQEGCELIEKDSSKKGVCECKHLSAFAILMSKAPLEVEYLLEVTYIGLSVSIVSLILCLAIELFFWSDVVKTDTLHLRHCAHVNIAVCLLFGDVCFLASSLPGQMSDIWCKTFVAVEHFCFLAMFFWMFSLSSILLHKTVYLSLHGVSKTAYLRYSVVVGYVSPLLIVAITFLAYNGAEGQYYSKETRWLIYNGTLKGSIFTFILPVGVIVFVNIFFMCLVIARLLQPIKATHMTETKDKKSVKMVIRSVILLTPVFGLTWGLGFLVILVDLTHGPAAYAVNYIFTIMNAFQGLYIFLTTCLGDRMVRDELRRFFKKKTSSVAAVSSSACSVNKSSVKE